MFKHENIMYQHLLRVFISFNVFKKVFIFVVDKRISNLFPRNLARSFRYLKFRHQKHPRCQFQAPSLFFSIFRYFLRSFLPLKGLPILCSCQIHQITWQSISTLFFASSLLLLLMLGFSLNSPRVSGHSEFLLSSISFIWVMSELFDPFSEVSNSF